MDAWETLLDTSTLTPPGFDAWEHLSNQGSGTEVIGVYALADGLDLELDTMELEIEIETAEYDVEIDGGFDVEVETAEYDVEID